MADKSIIFSAPIVRALLDGRKTQTRRLLKPKGGLPAPVNLAAHGVGTYSGEHSDPASWGWPFAEDGSDASLALFPDLSGYAPGDRLYVREAWRPHYLGDYVWNLDVTYAADGELRTILDGEFGEGDWKWPKAADRGNVPSIHMPRWASRMWLEVTDVRVQRAQEISEADARAEGLVEYSLEGPGGMTLPCWHWLLGMDDDELYTSAVAAFRALWNSLHTTEGGRWQDNPWIVAISFKVHAG
ncbi:MAG: hypothetical protein VX309_00365, partial [Pseudomonadota bacterium]|nr:hypothetical protein [Pseudomonadota bacterium]